MKSLLDTKIFKYVYLCYAIMALWVAYTFPLNLILDIFWGKVGQAVILEKEDHDGVLAGLPAGEGVTELKDIDQFYELQVRGYERSNSEGWWDHEAEVFLVYPEYITFETDSIIPLGFYRRNNTKKSHSGGYWNGRHYISSGAGIPEFDDSDFTGAFYWNNQYYLVKLPDGNYVPAHLDDAYYVKYRLTGKVQLPLGVAVIKDRYVDTWVDLSPYLEKYGVSNERILDMYCEKRYEGLEVLYAVFALLSWPVLVLIGANFGVIIEALLLKKPMMQHFRERWSRSK